MPKHTHPRAKLTDAVARRILWRIADGEPLSRICGPGRARGVPDRFTVHRRLRQDADFRRAYLFAREVQGWTLLDEMVEIADGRSPLAGRKPTARRDRLRVRARQWLAAVMAPRV